MSDVITDLLCYTGTKTVVSETVSGVQGTVFRCCLTCLVVLRKKKTNSYDICKFSGFRRGVGEVFALVCCYVACIYSCLPTFRDTQSVPSSRVKQNSEGRMPFVIYWRE